MGKRDMSQSKVLPCRRSFAVFPVAALFFVLCLFSGSRSVKAAGYGLSNPVIDKSGVTTWDCVWFGSYYQSSSAKKEPVKWRVLRVSGSDALLLADVNLDGRPYHDSYDYVTWENCSLRAWLNQDFLNTAFTSKERSAIKTVTNTTNISPYANFTMAYGGNDTKDRIFCLSWDDLVNPAYGFPEHVRASKERAARSSDYTVSKGVLVDAEAGYEGNSWWWLRTPGYYNKCASFISHDGAFTTFSAGESGGVAVTSSFPGVRPALHLNLSKAVWSKAGQVTSEDKESTTKEEEEKEGSKTGESKEEETAPVKDINKITPSLSAANSARINKSIPAVTVTEKELTISADLKKQTMNVKFKKVSKAVNYRIAWRRGGASKWNYDWTAGMNHYTFSKLKKNQLLEFRVAPYAKISGAWNRGEWSSVKYCWFTGTTASVKALLKGFSIKIKKDKNATGYQILYGTDKKIKANLTNGKIKKLKAAQGGKEIKIRSLKKKTVYCIRWRPIRKYKGKTYLGLWDGPVSIKTN